MTIVAKMAKSEIKIKIFWVHRFDSNSTRLNKNQIIPIFLASKVIRGTKLAFSY